MDDSFMPTTIMPGQLVTPAEKVWVIYSKDPTTTGFIEVAFPPNTKIELVNIQPAPVIVTLPEWAALVNFQATGVVELYLFSQLELSPLSDSLDLLEKCWKLPCVTG